MRWTRTAVLTTGAVLTSLVGSPASAAAATPPPPTSISGFCASAGSGWLFRDTGGSVHRDAIRCAGVATITRGAPQGLSSVEFGPDLTVRRDQVASFISRMMDTAVALDTTGGLTALPAADDASDFTDVDDSNVHAEAIDRLFQAGIVNGGPSGLPADRYGPALGTTRGQMAALINRALGYLLGDTTAAPADYFVDDSSSVHQADINAVANLGIAVGNGGNRFSPQQIVPRDQMASFLMRSLAVLYADDQIADVLGVATGPRTGEGTASATSLPVYVGEDAAAHDGYDRVTFTFDEARPGWRVEYVDQLEQQGSGDPVDLAGNTQLQLVLDPVANVGREDDVVALPVVKQVQTFGVFEARLQAGIGIEAPADTRPPFTVGTVGNRIYVDVYYPAAG